MGRPILDRLRAAGHEVTVLVRTPEARAAAAAEQLAWAETVAGTVRDADSVFIVVLADEQVRSVVLGPGGVLSAMKAGATLVQHTTCHPATVQRLADEGRARGIAILDAALSGGPHDIAVGRLALWVGGEEVVLDEMRPLLDCYASPIMFVGKHGNGQRVKLVNNALFVAQIGLAIDAVRLASSFGIDEAAMLAALQHGSGASRALTVVAQGGSIDSVPSRLGSLMRKDIDVVLQVARSVGADLGIIGTILSSDNIKMKVFQETTVAQ
jgi:3-hydroxyisobutyrate dehydrogenase